MNGKQTINRCEQKWSEIHIGTGKNYGPGYTFLFLNAKVEDLYSYFDKHLTSVHYQRSAYGQQIVEDCKECERTSFAMWEFMYKLKLEESI